MRTSNVLGMVALLWAVSYVEGARAADAINGRRLSERWCVACHVIGAEQQSAITEAPPFSAIANKPDFDKTSLAFFLLDPHPKMPDLGLSRDAATDIAAFIATQRR